MIFKIVIAIIFAAFYLWAIKDINEEIIKLAKNDYLTGRKERIPGVIDPKLSFLNIFVLVSPLAYFEPQNVKKAQILMIESFLITILILAAIWLISN